MNHVVSKNIKNNKINDSTTNKLKFDSKYILSNNNIEYAQNVVISNLRNGMKAHVTCADGLKFERYSRDFQKIIKEKHTKQYTTKICTNMIEYSTAEDMY